MYIDESNWDFFIAFLSPIHTMVVAIKAHWSSRSDSSTSTERNESMIRSGHSILAMMVLLCFSSSLLAADRAQMLSAFGTLRENGERAIQAKSSAKVMVKGPRGKFTVVGDCPVDPGPVCTDPSTGTQIQPCLGIQVWGELAHRPGTYVNLTKHKWQRSEQFYLWIHSAVPIQVALFQNYPPDSGRASEQRSPDPRFPATFQTILPGQPYRFPVKIQLDDNLIDELMSIVAVRTDTGCLPINGAPQPVTQISVSQVVSASIQRTNGSGSLGGATDAQLGGVLSGQDQQSLKGPVMQQTIQSFDALHAYGMQPTSPLKFSLVDDSIPVADSQSFRDVCEIALTAGRIGQLELRLKKD
jgi:hypothetical protein